LASLVVGLGRPEEFGDEGPEVLEEGEVGRGNLPAGLQLRELVGLLVSLRADRVLVMEATRGAKVLAGREALAARGLWITMQAM